MSADFLKRFLRPEPATGDIERPGLQSVATQSLNEIRDWLVAHDDLVNPRGPVPSPFAGFCYVCDADRRFEAVPGERGMNWRETLRCEACGLINRWRAAVHFLECLCEPTPDAAIYITEAVTPLYDLLRERYPRTVGSEFSGDRRRGEHFAFGGRQVRMEDVTALTFAAASFDVVVSFDVLEHVPDYHAALREFERVLRPGGCLLLSAPFSFAEETEIRARVRDDGTIEHLLPPDYHCDPLSDEGVLCFQSFGMDLLDDLASAGFEDARFVCYASRPFAYLGKNVLFAAHKPG